MGVREKLVVVGRVHTEIEQHGDGLYDRCLVDIDRYQNERCSTLIENDFLAWSVEYPPS